jgi:5-methylthioadenosine/S-adenosylhomocysteine deaminase
LENNKSTIILPRWLILSPLQEPEFRWGLRVVRNTIEDIGPQHELLHKYPQDSVIEVLDGVLAPGFVNTHTHLYGVLAHGIPLAKAPQGFWAFLEDFWWPLVENRLDQEMICSATQLRTAQMVKSGVTTFYDCTEAPNAIPGCLVAQAQVVKQSGMRGILSFEASERINGENGRLGLKENTDFINTCAEEKKNNPDGALLSGLMCIHTTFTCSKDFIRKADALARENNVLLHAHVAEGTYEPDYAVEHFGKRTIPYYKEIGVAGSHFLASQCVQVNREEVDLIAETGMRVSHMPLSNCEVGGGIAPIPDICSAGVTTGLGTDGYIDNFFEVMRGAFLIHKAARQDPRVMPADLVWYLATEGGAKALGLERVGRIEKGWKADLQIIKANLPTPVESHNIYEQLLLYCNPEDVQQVMINGNWCVRDGEVLDADWDRMKAKTNEAARRLWQQDKNGA